MINLNTIEKTATYTEIIKKSKFITYLYPLTSLEHAKNIIEKHKQEHADATHVCYAYILDNLKKESDDGEPSGTAGIPMLQVLEKNNLNHVLCIVVRYFGKIKLGAGGLVRAYTHSANLVLGEENLIEMKKFQYMDIIIIGMLLIWHCLNG